MSATSPRAVMRAWPSYLVMTAFALFFLFPLVFMVISSLKPDGIVLAESNGIEAFMVTEFEDNYTSAFETSEFPRLFVNSVIITGSIVVVGTLINSMLAYALAWTRFRGRRFLLAVIVGLVIVPFNGIALPLLLMMSRFGLTNTYLAQILPFLASPFFIFMFYSYFLGLPLELEEAARIDGAGPLKVFRSIALPLSKPIFATAAILSFLFAWGDIFWAVMVTRGPDVRPVALGLSIVSVSTPILWGDVMAIAVAMAVPVLVVFVIFQRAFVESFARSGLK